MSVANWTDFPDLCVRARWFAAKAHADQADKQGRDYYEHHLIPIADLLRPYGVNAYVAGMLHDVLEDTPATIHDLRQARFPEAAISAVVSVSKQRGESYDALIARASANPLGRLVKLADNWWNMSGLDGLAANPITVARLRLKYEQAREVLEHHLEAGR